MSIWEDIFGRYGYLQVPERTLAGGIGVGGIREFVVDACWWLLLVLATGSWRSVAGSR